MESLIYDKRDSSFRCATFRMTFSFVIPTEKFFCFDEPASGRQVEPIL